MTQHISTSTEPEPSTAHPHAAITTTLGHDASRGPSGWWFGLLALLPIACCGLPLLLAAGVTAGSGAVLGGVTGGVLMLAAAVLAIWAMWRRVRATCPTDTSTATPPSRDKCC